MSLNCDFCNKTFSTKSNCNRHKKICSKQIEINKIFVDKFTIEKDELIKTHNQYIEELIQKHKEQEAKLLRQISTFKEENIKLESAYKTLEKCYNSKPSNIINNNNLSTTNNTTNNNLMNYMLPITDTYFDDLFASISKDNIHDGLPGIQRHIKEQSNLFKNIYKSNRQRNTIAYKENNTIKKDEKALDLSQNIIKAAQKATQNFDTKSHKIISADFYDLKNNKNLDKIQQNMAKFIYTNCKTENGLRHIIIIPDLKQYETLLLVNIIFYFVQYNSCKEYSLCYGIDALIFYLYKKETIKIIIDDEIINDTNHKIFITVLQKLLFQLKPVIDYFYTNELSTLGKSHDYFDITKESWETWNEFIENSDSYVNRINELIESYN